MNDLGIENLTDVREIGRGGFSVVYAATNALLGTRVAVKVLGQFSDESDRRAFERECQVMGRLSRHPNVVTVHHAGYAADGSPYLIMELVEGGSLADRLAGGGPLPWPEALDMTVPIAEALAYVHQAGILHRDVKPENILIGSQGQALLTDFGIARLGDAATNTSTGIAASWLHAPPETFDNQREARSDLYSLASTLHQMITGNPPFWRGREESLNPLMYRLVNEPAPRLSPDLVPVELANIVERSLAKTPDQRPPGLSGFATELTKIRNSVAPAAFLPTPPRPSGASSAGFNPDPRAAAAAPADWFGPDSATVSAVDGGLDDRAPAPSTTRRNRIVAAISTAVAVVAMAGVGVATFIASDRGSEGQDVGNAETATTIGITTTGPGFPSTTLDPRTPQTFVNGGRLANVIARGELNCGVNGSLPLFGIENADGTFSGFDVDFCRVVAAAVLGDADAVNFVPLTAAERFTALHTGEIDVLMRNTSQTASRAGVENVEFPYTTFFDGQGLLVREDSGIGGFGDLDGAAVCVVAGTTTELNIEAETRNRGFTTTILAFEDNTALTQAYETGTCDGWTTDVSSLAVSRLSLANPGDHIVIGELLTNEPLGPAVKEGDAEWATAVEWSVMATVQAWEVGLDSGNIASYDGNDLTARLIAGNADFDPGFGLQPAYTRLVVEQVGNYREIYEANFSGSGLALDGSANDLARNGGQLFAAPLR